MLLNAFNCSQILAATSKFYKRSKMIPITPKCWQRSGLLVASLTLIASQMLGTIKLRLPNAHPKCSWTLLATPKCYLLNVNATNNSKRI